jgi:hypothetical protein
MPSLPYVWCLAAKVQTARGQQDTGKYENGALKEGFPRMPLLQRVSPESPGTNGLIWGTKGGSRRQG